MLMKMSKIFSFFLLLMFCVLSNSIAQTVPPLKLISAKWKLTKGLVKHEYDVTAKLQAGIDTYCKSTPNKWTLSESIVGTEKDGNVLWSPKSWQTKLFGRFPEIEAASLGKVSSSAVLVIDYEEHGVKKNIIVSHNQPLEITANTEIKNPVDSTDYSKSIPKINYGDVIRLTTFSDKKVENGMTLHSHSAVYNSGTSKNTSGQQQVTGVTWEDDNDWWIVSSPLKSLDEARKDVVRSGDKIMLIHVSTNKALHSHTNVVNDTNGWDSTLKAPDNEHREITCLDPDKNNIGNSWIVKVYKGEAPESLGSEWDANKTVVLERFNPNLGAPEYKTDYHEYCWISDKTFSPDGNPQNLQHIVGLNKTPSYFIVADIKNKPSYIYGSSTVEVPINLPEKWFAEDGKFSKIAVGSTSSGEMRKYAIGMDGKLYEFNNNSMSDNPWDEVKEVNDTVKQSIGNLIDLTVSADGNMLVITAEDKIFEFDFTKKVWTEIKIANQPKLEQISCGNSATVVVKASDNKLYKLEDKKTVVEISEKGAMVVATLNSHIFGLNLNGNVYQHIKENEWKALPVSSVPLVYIAAADTVGKEAKATGTKTETAAEKAAITTSATAITEAKAATLAAKTATADAKKSAASATAKTAVIAAAKAATLAAKSATAAAEAVANTAAKPAILAAAKAATSAAKSATELATKASTVAAAKSATAAAKSATAAAKAAAAAAKTTKTVGNTIIFGIDKNLALWTLILGETKWTPILGKDGKQSTGFSKIATNGVSHAALDDENDNYHFGELGVKVSADKKVEPVKITTKTRTQAISAGALTTKAAAKAATKKSVKTKSSAKKSGSKTKVTKIKKATNAPVTAKTPVVKKTTQKTATAKTAKENAASKGSAKATADGKTSAAA
jgi:hypothetical protein